MLCNVRILYPAFSTVARSSGNSSSGRVTKQTKKWQRSHATIAYHVTWRQMEMFCTLSV